MIKMTLLIARKQGLSVDEFINYWTGEHLRVVMSVPEVTRYSRRYRQQHNTYAAPTHTTAAPFDGIAEGWFDSLDHAMSLIDSDNWKTVIKNDDLAFLDVSRTQIMLSKEKAFGSD
ncbi:EthD domain-containing protein [Caballeronia sp. LZ035]|uniref:EthD domain-containing protein n=1 Tax=Caballeronia sp. LZ035 TaxID=3038568 RepID=UPI00286504FF|nr:EthD domain-containing protein [Caballeronia sp. LZ035]MDR5763248.1 EthD domain-containing protein [Caballeronia sp. LZ035]